MLGTRDKNRLESVAESVGSTFIPAGAFCSFVLHESYPHEALWRFLALILWIIGTLSLFLSILLRWRRKHRRRINVERFDQRAKEAAAQQLRAEGIHDRRAGGGQGLLSEPVLVFLGVRAAQVFDQNANQVGAARRNRSLRVRRGSPVYFLELLDRDGNALLEIERVGWLVRSATQVVRRPDGSPVGVVGKPWSPVGSETIRAVTSDERSLGHLRFRGRTLIFEDQAGGEVAKITRSHLGVCVAELAETATEPLRTIAVAASMVWDLATPEDGGP